MVFGLFSKERALQRTIKKATNKLTQSPERWAAMEKLLEVGTDDALHALLRRFTFASLKSIEDQQEKDWVVQALTAKGEVCVPALRRFMKSSTAIAHPLRILEGVADRDKALEVVDDLLSEEQPGYTRDPEKRIQIIDWLAEWKACSNEDVVERVAPYLADFDESVRFAATEALSLRSTPDAAEPLVMALINPDEESGRLRVRIAEIMAETGLSLCGQKKAVQPLLDDLLREFRVQKDKLVRRKKPKS
ncbi:MAG: HEAT repeat domain-containing protein [Proteobacteria bacterium]|nr:HEAT repeat domain-containing protein [Pseudomonadota bacterium]